MATTLSDFSASSLRLLPLPPLHCQSFKPSSSPLISNHIPIAKSSSSKSFPLRSTNRNRDEIEKKEARCVSSSQLSLSSTSENSEESRLSEQLRRLIESGNYIESITLVESMCAKGYQPDSYLCSVLLHELSEALDPDNAARLVTLLEAQGRQHNHAYDMFISCLCKTGRVVAAFEALGRMRSHGYHSDNNPCNSLVKVLCHYKMLEAALATVQHFRTEYGCAPNWIRCGDIIECAIVTRGAEELPALLDQMVRDGLQPDNGKMEAMYRRVIDRLCKSGKAEEALGFIKHLSLKGSGLHATSYIALVKLLLINGKKQDACSVIDEMLMRIQRLERTYLRDIVRLLCAHGLVRRAREIIDVAVREFGLDADMSCCSILIAAYLEDNRMDLVIELVDFMTSIQQNPNVAVYNTIITGLCKMGHVKEAIEVLDNMSYFGVPPNGSTYNRIIGGLWRNGEKKTAVKMLERMVEETGLSLNMITYNVIMTCLSQDGMVDEALEMFQVMEVNGVAADVVSYNALLLGYCNTARMEEAMRLFEEMLEKQCEPHWRTYSIILRVAISAGYKAKVVDLINEMDEKDILSKDSMTFLKDDLLSDHKSDT